MGRANRHQFATPFLQCLPQGLSAVVFLALPAFFSLLLLITETEIKAIAGKCAELMTRYHAQACCCQLT
jgi:hypothetical protein